MKRYLLRIIILCLFIHLFSCSTTRYLPDGEYLLNKMDMKVAGEKIYTSPLEEFVRQKPNSDFLFIPKLRLKIYSLSGKDTSRAINRILKKMGSPPVVYDSLLTQQSIRQLEQELSNWGYLHNSVKALPVKNGRKVNLTYYIETGEQYLIRNYTIDVEQDFLKRLFKSRSFRFLSDIESGDPFEAKPLDLMLKKLTATMRNMGFYYLSDENFYFLVDTMVGNHRVDIGLKYRPIPTRVRGKERDLSLTQCHINQLYLFDGYDYFDTLMRKRYSLADTLQYRGLNVINFGKNLIRPPILYYHNFIRPGALYSDRAVDNTYASFNSLGAVDRVNVRFRPLQKDSSRLDAIVTLSPSKIYYFQWGIDGTNSAGDLGVSTHLSFQHKNLFGGAEVLKLKLKGAFEHVNANDAYSVVEDNYYEYGGEVSLTFPRLLLFGLPERFKQQVGAATLFTFGADWRKRPEYHRRFLTWDWKYNWKGSKQRLSQIFTLYNINYVAAPWTSSWFQDYLNKPENIILKESYKDLFITRSSYSFLYHRDYALGLNNSYSLQGAVEMAGTLPALICRIFSVSKRDGAYNILGIPFAQYLKMTLSAVRSFPLPGKNSLVLHGALGFASPFGNSVVIPYEQRFYAGGSSSVRGWATRTLGPGSYLSDKNDDFLNRTGEVKLLLNVEYRLRTRSVIEFAFFLDAGNIWTIRNYPNQKGGAFRWNNFYREIAFSWGLGIRPNFKFVVLRLDAGMKLYDPAGEGRWTFSHLKFWDDFALHFAVGYPF